jgi:tetratricopeptide (TPR) repeat protein
VRQNIRTCGIALLLSAAPGMFPMRAQAPVGPSPEALQKLEQMTDQIRALLEKGDLKGAQRQSSELMLAISKEAKALEPTPQDKLAKLELETPASGRERFYALAGMAKAAFSAGELNKAELYARELLSLAPDYQKDWNYGNAVFVGNMVIGRVALRRDKNTVLAKSYLLASGETPGSPQLNSFGPNMSLAKDLLEQGERDTVLEFFAKCRKFWKLDNGRLDAWTAEVRVAESQISGSVANRKEGIRFSVG